VASLFEDFCRAFNQADLLLVTDIYAAGEDPLPGVTGEGLAEGIKAHGHRDVRYVDEMQKVPGLLRGVVQEGDLVITLGAGSVTALAEDLAEMIRERG
jgi:UDP-N-acetylmuramate--alanine ligase